MTRYRFMLIVIVCIGLSAYIAFAEENVVNGVTIQGEVIEAIAEQKPIENVEVKIVSSTDKKEWTVKTDAKGKYELIGLPAGRYTISVSKKGYQPRVGKSKVVAPGGEIFDRIKMIKKDNSDMRFVEGLLLHVAENLGKRYNLEASKVPELHKSILHALNTVLEQENREVREFGQTEQEASIGFIMAILSHPDCKAVFAKYLTDTQLQDYIDFTKARQLRVRQAVAQFMTAVLDQTLSLTVDQRKHIAKLLLDTISNKPEFALTAVIDGPIPQGIINLIQNELEVSLDSVLNQTQTKICDVMIDYYDGKDLVGAEMLLDPQADEIVEKDEPDEDTAKSQEWILTEAILMAHTKRLGSLNESGSKRLKTATNGVVQQYIEAQNPDIDDDFKFIAEIGDLMQTFMRKVIPRDEALERLEVMKNELWGERGKNKKWDKIELHNITNHPLYQQAIKDVLSEDAYMQYKVQQVERENFRIQASRNLALPFIDMIVLLNEVQQQKIKMITAQLTIPSLNYRGLQLMFAELFIMMDNDILNPWQQSVFKGGR